MINISSKATQDLQNSHLLWAHEFIVKKLYRRNADGEFYAHVVTPTYPFEKDFYTDLAADPLSNEIRNPPSDLLREIILFPANHLDSFKDSDFFNNHKLFIFLCLGKSVRERDELIEVRNTLIDSYPDEMGREDAISDELRARLKKILSYDAFSESSLSEPRSIHEWHAYTLTRNISNLYCPYCNLVATEHVERLTEEVVVDGENNVEVVSVLRPSLDHYLDKDNYPFFCISFYNLIPSCSACNERLKRTADFGLKIHANPYSMGCRNAVKFILKNNGVDDEFLRSRYTEGEVDINKLVIASINDNSSTVITERMNNNLETFEILLRYNSRKEELKSFLECLPLLSEARVNTMTPLKMRGTLKQSVIYETLNAEPDPENHGNAAFAVIKYNLIEEYAPHLLND